MSSVLSPHVAAAAVAPRPGARPTSGRIEHERTEDAARLRTMTLDNFQLIWRSLRRFGVPREAVDDATQQVFEIAARKLGQIVVGSERPFLFQTALRVAAGVRRSHARRREVCDEETLHAQRDPRPDPEHLADLKERRERLDELLDAMPTELRTVFVLFELEGMSSLEIAAAHGIPVGTATSRLRRAREDFSERVKRARASLGGSS